MFHRVDEPMDLPSSRYFRMAQRLHLRGGAVTAALADSRTVEEEVRTAPSGTRDEQTASRGAAVAEGTAADVAAIAAMSQHPGFPSIGYSRG